MDRDIESMLRDRLTRELKPKSDYEVKWLIDDLARFGASITDQNGFYKIGDVVDRLIGRADNVLPKESDHGYFYRGVQSVARFIAENKEYQRGVPATLEREIFSAIELKYASSVVKYPQNELTMVFLEGIETIRKATSSLPDSNREGKRGRG